MLPLVEGKEKRNYKPPRLICNSCGFIGSYDRFERGWFFKKIKCPNCGLQTYSIYTDKLNIIPPSPKSNKKTINDIILKWESVLKQDRNRNITYSINVVEEILNDFKKL